VLDCHLPAWLWCPVMCLAHDLSTLGCHCNRTAPPTTLPSARLRSPRSPAPHPRHPRQPSPPSALVGAAQYKLSLCLFV
jgi:hypothetical protein